MAGPPRRRLVSLRCVDCGPMSHIPLLFRQQHLESVMIWNYQTAVLKSNNCVVFYNFPHTFVPYLLTRNYEITVTTQNIQHYNLMDLLYTE